MKFPRILLLLTLPVYLFSCAPQQKIPNYLENVTDTTWKELVKFPELRIQKGDLLSIQVMSLSNEPDISDAMYNLPATNGGAGGFMVDAYGNIEYPRLGTIQVEGLTKNELAALVKKKLTSPAELLKDPIVIIRFLNYKITVIGQVGHEAVLSVPGERLTILEAVGLAGGITDYGKKTNVKILRENNGKREIGIIDLSSKDLFGSPYYNLVQNDVVFVEATQRKARQDEQNVVAQRITFALSLITTAAFIYNIFK